MTEVRCLSDAHLGRFVAVAETRYSGPLRYVEHGVVPRPPEGCALPPGVTPGHTTLLVLGLPDGGVTHVWAMPHHAVVVQEPSLLEELMS